MQLALPIHRRLADRWPPWFHALDALGENTDIRWGKVGFDGVLLASGTFAHADHDGVGMFARLLREHEGYEGGLPAGPLHAPPPRRRLEVLRRVLLAPDRPPFPWKRAPLLPSKTLPRAFAFTVLSPADTARLVTPKVRGAAILSVRLLRALDEAVIPELADPHRASAGACAPHVWLMPVNMRPGGSKALRNRISFLPIGYAEGATSREIQKAMRAAVKADLHWGTWDAMGARALLGERFVRLFAALLYRGLRQQGGTGWLGSYSFGGVVPREGAKFAWFGVPPVSLMWPIGAAVFAWGGRMSLGLQVHDDLGKDAAWAQKVTLRWRELALAEASSGS